PAPPPSTLFPYTTLFRSEVAILSVATVTQLGKKNVLAGVLIGSLVSIFTFLAVRQVFVLLPDLLIDFITSAVLIYFSSRFLRGLDRKSTRLNSSHEWNSY